MNWLRTAAWTVYALDLVILAQMAYAVASGSGGGPTGQALLRGFTLMLASGLLGIGLVLVVSSWRRSRVGLWVSLICAALPLLWVGAGMLGVFE